MNRPKKNENKEFFIHLAEGIRIFLNSWKTRLFGCKNYPGNAGQICRQIIDDCWNGAFFQASAGNFANFWTRDFAFCTEALLALGYKKEVQQTLHWALAQFKKHQKITTTITKWGNPFDFPMYSVDSLPLLLRSLRRAKIKITPEKRFFLNNEIKKFHAIAFDPKTCLIRADRHFSSIKDQAKRKSSCYDNVMLLLLIDEIRKAKLYAPFPRYDYKKNFINAFWNGSFFHDDSTKQSYVAGDANTFPFSMGIISDKQLLRKAIGAIKKNNLDLPFPLKYTQKDAPINFFWQRIFAPSYERDSCWLHLGFEYIKAVAEIDKKRAKHYLQQYQSLLEKHKNFLEVFSADGKPYSSFFYQCDAGMLWAANWVYWNKRLI